MDLYGAILLHLHKRDGAWNADQPPKSALPSNVIMCILQAGSLNEISLGTLPNICISKFEVEIGQLAVLTATSELSLRTGRRLYDSPQISKCLPNWPATRLMD